MGDSNNSMGDSNNFTSQISVDAVAWVDDRSQGGMYTLMNVFFFCICNKMRNLRRRLSKHHSYKQVKFGCN